MSDIFSTLVRTICISSVETYLKERVLKKKLANKSSLVAKIVCRTFSAVTFLLIHFIIYTIIIGSKSLNYEQALRNVTHKSAKDLMQIKTSNCR